MMTENRLNNAMIYISALSLLFCFSGFFADIGAKKRMGTGLLSFINLSGYGFIFPAWFYIFKFSSRLSINF